mmetsp:Transcript_18756/g.32246  ORF Transcript_18756/g.32246 Transcript_18756/m.32246 type:complete len:210 (+) Transcript_18756:666-1295(+)
MRHPRQLIHLLDRNRINLIIKITTRLIHPIPHNHIDQLIHGNILPRQQIGTIDTILSHNLRRQFFRIGPQFRQWHGGREPHPARSLLFEGNVRRTLIHAYSHRFQFQFQYFAMAIQPLLSGVEHDEDGVGVACAGDDFLAASFAVGGALDDAGEVEDLDLGALVVHGARDAGEGCEFVGGGFGFGAGEFALEGGFADGGETDEGDAGVS